MSRARLPSGESCARGRAGCLLFTLLGAGDGPWDGGHCHRGRGPRTTAARSLAPAGAGAVVWATMRTEHGGTYVCLFLSGKVVHASDDAPVFQSCAKRGDGVRRTGGWERRVGRRDLCGGARRAWRDLVWMRTRGAANGEANGGRGGCGAVKRRGNLENLWRNSDSHRGPSASVLPRLVLSRSLRGHLPPPVPPSPPLPPRSL